MIIISIIRLLRLWLYNKLYYHAYYGDYHILIYYTNEAQGGQGDALPQLGPALQEPDRQSCCLFVHTNYVISQSITVYVICMYVCMYIYIYIERER